MIRFQGKGVCAGIALGTVNLFQRKTITATKYENSDTQAELQRLQDAVHTAICQLNHLASETKQILGDSEAQIFEIHAMMLEDEDLLGYITDMISQQHCNAEYAVHTASEEFAARFSSMEEEYMQARKADVQDIAQRLLRCLSKEHPATPVIHPPCILCADDLSPSETAGIPADTVLGIATANGSANSHTAILAKSMDIPAIVALGNAFYQTLHNGDVILIDGDTGECILSPDEDTIRAAKKKQKLIDDRRHSLHALSKEETLTKDGKTILLYANIGNAKDMEFAIQNGAEGIGLYRSEFLYLQQETYPDEATLLQAYQNLLQQMPNQRVVIRTLDMGADKQASYFHLPQEENPALGVRGIRLCLARPDLFRTQLRALYRASVLGKLSIMFPMVTTAEELREVLAICKSVRNELATEGLPFSDDVELGIMIETPAAALISDQLAELVDFFSIGTNDLTQYTLACDRQNVHLEYLNAKHSQAVMRLMEYTIQNAHAKGIWVGICGEMASDQQLAESFIRMGADELSVSPKDILPLRKCIRELDLSNSIKTKTDTL